MRTTLTEEDRRAFEPSVKVGLVATRGPAGEPHVTLLTTLMGCGDSTMTIGQFARGESKVNMRARPEVGFLVMGLDMRMWRGRAIWRRSAKEGHEYEAYNRQPMFRYNAYFGINGVHYLDLAGIEGPDPLPMPAIAAAWVVTALRARGARPGAGPEVLPPFARAALDKMMSLNFIAYVERGVFPRIVPVIQARSAGPSRIVLSDLAFRSELAAIPEGTRVALFSMNLDMESFLAEGELSRPARGLAAVDLDRLYNTAPPCPGRVYPPAPLGQVTELA